MENTITDVIGGGVAATYHTDLNMWIVSLTEFEPGKGYWVRHNPGAPTIFNWNQCTSTSSSTQFQYFDFVFPNGWEDMPINNVFNILNNQMRSSLPDHK